MENNDDLQGELIISEEELTSLLSNKRKMFSEIYQNDPNSPFYVRYFPRPKINWWKIIGVFFTWNLIWILALFFITKSFDFNFSIRILIGFSIYILFILIHLKMIVISLVKIYQHYAPEKIRGKCVFEPSCSQYMIDAIRKYGAIRGIKKGILRLFRCKPGMGGFDYP